MDWLAVVLAGATVVLALGTLALAGVAWLETQRREKRRPAMSLTYDPRDRDSEPEQTESGPVDYLRLRVLNEPGKDTAIGVQVTLMQLNTVEYCRECLAPLAWTHYPANEVRQDIPPGSCRFVDFIRQQGKVASEVELCLPFTPIAPWRTVGEGSWVARLELSASNADAIEYVVIFDVGTKTEIQRVVRWNLPTTSWRPELDTIG